MPEVSAAWKRVELVQLSWIIDIVWNYQVHESQVIMLETASTSTRGVSGPSAEAHHGFATAWAHVAVRRGLRDRLVVRSSLGIDQPPHRPKVHAAPTTTPRLCSPDLRPMCNIGQSQPIIRGGCVIARLGCGALANVFLYIVDTSHFSLLRFAGCGVHHASKVSVRADVPTRSVLDVVGRGWVCGCDHRLDCHAVVRQEE
jgi:hypothetical protein